MQTGPMKLTITTPLPPGVTIDNTGTQAAPVKSSLAGRVVITRSAWVTKLNG